MPGGAAALSAFVTRPGPAGDPGHGVSPQSAEDFAGIAGDALPAIGLVISGGPGDDVLIGSQTGDVIAGAAIAAGLLLLLAGSNPPLLSAPDPTLGNAEPPYQFTFCTCTCRTGGPHLT